jgi:hypothetical protein
MTGRKGADTAFSIVACSTISKERALIAPNQAFSFSMDAMKESAS